MGRQRLKIACLPTSAARQTTYSKRRQGLAKKAREISVLCGADLVLLSFSPADHPSLILGHNCDLSAILGRFAEVNPQEREKRKQETLQALKRAFTKEDHELNARLRASEGLPRIKDYLNRLKETQEKIDEANFKLRRWNNPEVVNIKLEISMMEETLLKSLERIQLQKKHFVELHGEKGIVAPKDWYHPYSTQSSDHHHPLKEFPHWEHARQKNRSKGRCKNKGKGLNS